MQSQTTWYIFAIGYKLFGIRLYISQIIMQYFPLQIMHLSDILVQIWLVSG